MMRDLFDTLRSDAATAEHVGEERADVIAPLRTAEGNDKNCVEYLQSSIFNLSIDLARDQSDS